MSFKNSYKILVYRFDKFIFDTIFYVFHFFMLGLGYMMWRKQYNFVGGAIRGYFESKKEDEGISPDDILFLSDAYGRLLEKREWWAAADVGCILRPIQFPEECYREAIKDGKFLQAESIAREVLNDEQKAQAARNLFYQQHGI